MLNSLRELGSPQGILSRQQELGTMRCGKEAPGGRNGGRGLTWAGTEGFRVLV